ncbi:oocyte zinc finger protein XlCOF6-like [Anopheles cruzii]|uniref:oocyte zinc finger protein XlCOF6-like n=1 Tax=Anopheles cruzii TaxID=68878 RepID=UPI0022EC717B|nr:oocyte zinc finger protein XlCOF6-like [Anopheles cruzii]
MDILIEPDCFKVCRICMENCEEDFVCIYDEFEDIVLSEIIAEFTSVDIQTQDALPGNACRNCAENMVIAYYIIQKCRESDASLRSIFRHELNLRNRERHVATEDRITMDPSDYEFLLADAYDDMMRLDGDPTLLLGEHNFTTLTVGADSTVEQPLSSAVTEHRLHRNLSPSQQHEEKPRASLNAPCEQREPSRAMKTMATVRVLNEVNEEHSLSPIMPIKCCGCRKLFQNEQSLREHCENVHLPPEWRNGTSSDDASNLRCTVCYREFSSLQLLKNHQRTTNRKFVCPRCGKRFMTQTNLDTHSKCHNDRETHKCCGCRMEFETKLDLMRHSHQVHQPERTEIADKPFECETCFRRYPTRKSLATHQRMTRQFQCRSCGAIFMKQLFLSLHLERTHRQEVEQQQKHQCCGGCRGEFADLDALREHSNQIHGKEKDQEELQGTNVETTRPFQCPTCRKRFSSANTLLQHRQKVFRKKCCTCAICGRTFSRANDLSNHSTTHSNEMPFECSICGRRFKNKIYLKNHHKLHASDAKEHACRQCGKCFRTKDLLKTHLISHSQERKYGCTICGATFKRLQCLKIHKRVHTREKKYECTVCRKCYVQASDLKRHMLIHNPGDESKPFQCEYCLRRYPRKDYLKVHIRRQHPEKRTDQTQILRDEMDLCFTVANVSEPVNGNVNYDPVLDIVSS